MLLFLVGCTGSVVSTVTTSPPLSDDDAGREADASPSREDAAVVPESEGPDVDAGSATSSWPVSEDCFAFDSCGDAGALYWCGGDAGRPPLEGCVDNGLAQSGWAGTCCPGAAVCTRLSSDDDACSSQCSQTATGIVCLPGNAVSCPGADVAPAGCLPSGTRFDLQGVAVLPSRAGAALSPAQGTSLYCCP
jgi:hypothetical protein